MIFNFDGMLLKAVVHNNDQPRLLASRQRTTPYCATPKNCPTVRVMKHHHELAPAAASHHMSSQLSGTSSALASDQSMRLRRAYPKKVECVQTGIDALLSQASVGAGFGGLFSVRGPGILSPKIRAEQKRCNWERPCNKMPKANPPAVSVCSKVTRNRALPALRAGLVPND